MVMGFPALRWANLTCTWDGLENQGIGPGQASQWLWSSPGQYSPGWSVAFVLALSCPSSPPTAVPTPSRPRPITPHPFLQFAALITAGQLSLLHSHEIPHSNRQLLRPVLCPENYSSVVSPPPPPPTPAKHSWIITPTHLPDAAHWTRAPFWLKLDQSDLLSCYSLGRGPQATRQ